MIDVLSLRAKTEIRQTSGRGSETNSDWIAVLCEPLKALLSEGIMHRV